MIPPTNSIIINGDSMAPTMRDGAIVTFKTEAPDDGGLALFELAGQNYLKRLFRSGSGYVVKSDNPDKARFPDWEIPPGDIPNMTIIGRPVTAFYDTDRYL